MNQFLKKCAFKDTEYTGGHVLGETPEFPIVIEENFTFYNVDLNDGLMTGIFLDQKEVRKNYVIILPKIEVF